MFVQCNLYDCKFVKDNLNGDCDFSGAVAYSCNAVRCEGFEPTFR
jgi:hypothetical protein